MARPRGMTRTMVEDALTRDPSLLSESPTDVCRKLDLPLTCRSMVWTVMLNARKEQPKPKPKAQGKKESAGPIPRDVRAYVPAQNGERPDWGRVAKESIRKTANKLAEQIDAELANLDPADEKAMVASIKRSLLLAMAMPNVLLSARLKELASAVKVLHDVQHPPTGPTINNYNVQQSVGILPQAETKRRVEELRRKASLHEPDRTGTG